MKIVLVTPRAGGNVNLKAELKRTEKRLRGGSTTFLRAAEGRWKHVKYVGWIKFDRAPGGILAAEIQTRKPDTEWQLLQSFIGYLDRHLGDHIETITIAYR